MATTEEAAKWIAHKIKYLMEEEGLTREQAAGKAFGMAKEKFGKDSVPEK